MFAASQKLLLDTMIAPETSELLMQGIRPFAVTI